MRRSAAGSESLTGTPCSAHVRFTQASTRSDQSRDRSVTAGGEVFRLRLLDAPVSAVGAPPPSGRRPCRSPTGTGSAYRKGHARAPTTDARRGSTGTQVVWKAAELEPISLHQCRHTFASLMIAAGVNAKALASFMGHASITMTLDRYGHLMPGAEDEAAERLDAFLAREAMSNG